MGKEADNKKIGKNIRHMREFSNITREELADKASISVNFLKNLEYGIKGASITTLSNLSKELNVPLDYLVFGEDNNTINNNNEELLLLLNSMDEDDRKKVQEIIVNIILAMNNKK
ncbi:transcriptional regulator with XRE-family HTH domain [Bacilli bacterium PM5-3]|nr:transcriptional regulator with XRE-family HTH domain [Bacilli bacterium PM5-3]